MWRRGIIAIGERDFYQQVIEEEAAGEVFD
jgi:hypothetical protein